MDISQREEIRLAQSLSERDSRHEESETLWETFGRGRVEGAAASAEDLRQVLMELWGSPKNLASVLRFLEHGLEQTSVSKLRRLAQLDLLPFDEDDSVDLQ